MSDAEGDPAIDCEAETPLAPTSSEKEREEDEDELGKIKGALEGVEETVVEEEEEAEETKENAIEEEAAGA